MDQTDSALVAVTSAIPSYSSIHNEHLEPITYEHRHCGGRRSFSDMSDSDARYHGVKENPYPLPNDDAEKTRLDNLQFCVQSRLGANIVAPISPHPNQIGFKLTGKLIVS
jgi:hypothetical protein